MAYDPYLKAAGIYEEIEFTLSTGQTNYDLDAQQATFLAKFSQSNYPYLPTKLRIRTNKTITVRLNDTANHAITIASTDSPFEVTGVKISNVYLSNSSGEDAAVKLLFLPTI